VSVWAIAHKGLPAIQWLAADGPFRNDAKRQTLFPSR